ncbi:MAG: twin-arginine translocase subunit TatB [bacterium]|nr:twin-arginine translocase subunit TatB [bacterium]
MFGSLGGAELALLLVLALLLFGPRKLPQIGRTLGKGLSEFRRASNDFRASLEREVDLESVKSVKNEVSQTVDEVRKLSVARSTESSRKDPEPEKPAEPSEPAEPASTGPEGDVGEPRDS